MGNDEIILYVAKRIKALKDNEKNFPQFAAVRELKNVLRRLDTEFATAENGREEMVVLEKIISYGEYYEKGRA